MHAKQGFGDIMLAIRKAIQNSRCLNFLRLLPVNYEVDINKLKNEKSALENEIKIIKTIAKDISKLKAEKIKLESEIFKMEKMLDSIDVSEKIDYDEEKYKYEFPGDKHVTQYELVIIDAVNKTARKANVDKWPDQYVMVFETSSKGDLVFFERTKRTWDEVDVCSVNTNTMEVKEFINEVE